MFAGIVMETLATDGTILSHHILHLLPSASLNDQKPILQHIRETSFDKSMFIDLFFDNKFDLLMALQYPRKSQTLKRVQIAISNAQRLQIRRLVGVNGVLFILLIGDR